NWRGSVLIGVLSFAVPFGCVWFVAQFVFSWPLHQAQIAGIALSTTSVAVVYAVMIEGGFSDTAVGKLILAACFITDFGPVLPAYLLGLVLAGVFLRDKTLVRRMRSIGFAVFTPFYFIKAGLYVSLPALWTGLLVISVFLTLKIVTKIAGVFPLARLHYMRIKEASYTTLLMATGLTFGTISSLYGLQNGIINQNQYTILVSVVILSAFVPTLIAQKFFQPTVEMMHAWGRLYRKRMRVLSVEDMVDNGELEIGRSSR